MLNLISFTCVYRYFSALFSLALLAEDVCAPLPLHPRDKRAKLVRIERQRVVLREHELASSVVLVFFLRCLLLLRLAGCLCFLFRHHFFLDPRQHHLELFGINVEVDEDLLVNYLRRPAERLLQLLEDHLELNALSIV